jgi:type VI secretion system protein ImpC
MRAVLHHPRFQALESAWRGADWLLSGLDVGESWELWALDVTQAELEQDLRSAGTQLTSSQVSKLLVEPSNGLTDVNPWSLLVGDYTFGPSIEHVDVLAAMGALGSVAGAPFLAAADPLVVGCPSLADGPEPSDWVAPDPKSAERWTMLRRSPAATWLGLALPRLLLRLPYGKETDPCESFDFEELSAAREHNHYLWGNPAMGCAMLMARRFSDHSWGEGPGDSLFLSDLPAHAYREGGETKLQAVAEAYLSERAWQQILGVGVMPFLSYRNRNAARLAMFQSLAEPRAALPFVWGAKPSAVSD